MQVKSKKKNLFTFVLIILTLIFPQTYKANTTQELAIFATAGASVDMDTGAIYCSKNLDQPIGLASISKFFVIDYFLDHMQEKNYTLATTIPISNNVATIKNRYEDASGIYLPEGQEVSIEKLIELALIFSDNGATLQLAEALSDNENAFINSLNQNFQAKRMVNTKFVNVTGLDETIDNHLVGNMSTTREAIEMTIEILQERPELLNITSQPYVEFNGEQYNNWNEMLPGKTMEYEGIKGLKTGSSEIAGFCFLGYCEQNNKKIITLIADAKNSNGQRSRVSRFSETARMLNYSETAELDQLITKDTIIPIAIKNKGITPTNLYPLYNISVLSGTTNNIIFEGIEYNSEYFSNNKIIKSIPKDKPIAYLKIKTTNNDNTTSIYYKGDFLEIPLCSKNNIDKDNIFLRIVYAIPRFFIDLYNTI